jgi:serine/threonine protein kinase/tetratricopeptide (TPR) repeat protein
MGDSVSGPSARARLGSFEVDLRSGELRSLEPGSSTGTVLLREQPFQILRMLIERSGKLVTRAEIKKALWPNDTIVDFDHGINVAIGVLRRALGDSAANPRYIETLGRRGYRLLASVDWVRTVTGANGTAVMPHSPARPAPRDMVGRKVGHYRVLEVLGGGGMGMVYKAEDLKLGRRVALKFLPEELGSDPIALARLEREARTASALNHPNICTIFDIEEFEGQQFIAMELLEGETLSARIAASAPDPMPRPEALDIAMQVCAGLQAAQEKGIVHRDIKPGNIFLTRLGPVKILDFGVAKLVTTGDADGGIEVDQDATPGVSPTTDPELTRTGVSVGTRAYMSPEQLRKQPLDARSDLFSMGLVLYEMATGRRAFADEPSTTTDETATGTKEGGENAPRPRPRTLDRAIPRALGATIGRALEADPANRYQTAAEMRRDLERIRLGKRSPEQRRIRFALAGAVLLVLLVSGTWLWRWRARPAVTLAPDDTIVIAHLTNETSNRVFDEALYTALRVGLEQTPYLNVLADSKVLGELKALKLAESTRVTPQIALEVCRHTGSRIVVSPSIADAGNRLRLELSGLDCRSGARIARVEQEAASQDVVIHALGMAGAQLRARLGEPAVSVAKFNTPLDQATSAAPEAVELLTLGYRRHLAGSPRDAVPYYERAIRADSNFALAHSALAVAQGNLGQVSLSMASARRAFELRERSTLPARRHIESYYYFFVTGEDDVGCDVVAQWVQTFPHDQVARQNFSACLSELGEPDRALGQAREAARLLPATWTYQWWVARAVEADRLDEARSIYEEALRRGFDSPELRDGRALLAFLEKDEETMREQWKWAEGKPGAEPILLKGRALFEAYHGRLRDSLHFAKKVTALLPKQGDRVELFSTLMQAESGIRGDVSGGMGAPDQPFETRILAALTLARVGKLDLAQKIAHALRREFPTHTLLQKYCLPLIDGAVKLESDDPTGAIEALKPAARFELTAWFGAPSLYSPYLRGLAFLRMRDGQAAAGEFRKMLAHPGLVGRMAIGAMARLQLARAEHLSGHDTAALPMYEEFLSLWKDADADVPLYKEAKAEYRRLRSP